MIYSNITELIGHTPLLRLSGIEKEFNCTSHIIAKLEKHNPAGSAKDRVALNMIRAAEKSGELAGGGLIIEPTSGNTGIGLAACAAVLGYRCCIVMPDSMSAERIKLIKAYGAEIVLTPGIGGMNACIEKAEEIQRHNPGSIIAGQFYNPHNPEAHYLSTGPEIWEDTKGNIDILVATVGTGGTISGTGKYLKEQNPDIKVVAVEPAASPLLSGGTAAPHGIQGIGANFIPEALDRNIYDEIICCKDDDALETMKTLARTDGVFCGISSGAALWAAIELAKIPENKGKTIVTVLPDTGERYLSVL
ncbi:MAG: cysteine synthase A [Oscillospiraceae bacterium]|nr:cysteine synthase A [Oscillospiraceae bacterium]